MIQLPYIIAGVVIILVIVIIFTGYKKAPPDTAFIISGLRKKIIIGKASVKLPFLERMDKLSLKLIAIDVKTTNAVPTADYINIQVDAAVNVKISSEPSRLALAAQNFLNQNTQYIASIAREVLEGNMREIVGRMRLEEMVSDRQKFANLVKRMRNPTWLPWVLISSASTCRISPMATASSKIWESTIFPRLRKKLPLQRRRRKRKSPLPKRRQIARPMTQGLIQNVKLPKRTMSLPCRRPS